MLNLVTDQAHFMGPGWVHFQTLEYMERGLFAQRPLAYPQKTDG